jgi:LuxR family transcriptional regulator, maltose regulon positive regulatory protein
LPDPLLITKLRCPRLPNQSIPRSRLTGLVNEALQAGQPLILISAPAGFGKSNLLGEWLLHSGWHTTWLTLDEEDNDLNRFWAYFIAALQVLREDLGENAQMVLRARDPLTPPDESFLTVLLNEIAAFSEPIVLVLDDYHLIDNSAIHNGFAYLIDHLPGQMHLILASRSDPPLPLARWRAGNQMAEIRAEDLRFTKEEAISFLVEILGFPLSNDEVAALVNRTEGWIAGLQLAALSMQGRQEVSTFITDFTGSHHYIFDYLSEEILQRQSKTVQLFLLHTSILDRLCAGLCETVTGQAGCQEMLEDLERSNLFLQRVDDERYWYRYHQLFAEVLRHHLRQAQPHLIPELHVRASKWFEQNGWAAEAIRYALAGKEFEWAADLVEANAITIHWRQGDNATLFRWLEELPDELIRSRPRLCLSHAWALLISGQLAAVESRLEDLEKFLAHVPDSGMEAVEIHGLRGQMAAIRASLARNRNDLPRAIELCRQALQYIPSKDVSLRAVISLNLGLAYWQGGDLPAASHILGEISMVDEQGGMLLTSLASQALLADMQAEQGRLHQAVRIYQQTIERGTIDHGRFSPVATWAHIGMGKVLLQWNDLQATGRYLEKGLELARQWGNADGLAWAFLSLAEWKSAIGAPEEADRELSQGEQVARQGRVTRLTASRVVGYRGKLWISQGKIAEADLWAQERDLEVENDVSYQRLPEYLSFARLLIVQGRLEEVDSLLERMLRLAESSALTGRVIEILLLQALTVLAQGKNGQAEKLLERALALAEPEGHIRLFVDEGEPMKLLLDKYVERQGSKRSDHHYAARLLATMTHRKEGWRIQSSASGSGALIDLLSERELEILRLLAEGLSNREIAQRSYISIGTVKAHLKHIYGKLEVGNRTEAAHRARQLSLI